MRRMRWLMVLVIVTSIGVSTRSFAFPWKKVHPVAYLPPYFGYYPTQWREFPLCEEAGITIATPDSLVKPESSVPTETLPMPKKSLTHSSASSAARGTAPQQVSQEMRQPTIAIPAPDPVPLTETERFVPPLATLGVPSRAMTPAGPAAMFEGSIVIPERNRIWRASAPEKD